MTHPRAALNAEQQSQILAQVKNLHKQRERLQKYAKSFPVSEVRYRATLHEQEERFRDFLKEL